jgi:hypothetical protein
MPVPAWSVGQVLSASDVNAWFIPVASVKTADQSVTSSVTFVNDTELLVPIVAAGTYQFECFLDYEGGTLGSSDVKWRWIVPTGTTMRYTWAGNGTGGGTHAGDCQIAGDTPSASSNGAGTLRGVMMIGTIVAGVNAGNMQLQWAQNVSSGTATIVHAQSCLVLRRIA